jgi:adenosylcobinamide-GDP ribazoletransferase
MGIALALATLLLGVNGFRAALITLVLVWALGQALKRTWAGKPATR